MWSRRAQEYDQKINNETDLLGSLKKIKKRFGRLRKITKFVKQTR